MISLIDAHCDTIVKIFETNEQLFENNGHIDLKKLLLYKTPLQFFAIFLEKKYLDRPFRNTLKFIDFFHEQIYKNDKYINTISNYDDFITNKQNNIASALLSIEGGEVLEGSISNLTVFYELGVRCMTITWNNKNKLGDGAMVPDGEGLTDFGKQVIKKMNEIGMIIDVSHLNEQGFWDVCEISKKPFIASHSNSFTIHNHPRNLKDDQIKAIAKSEGVIGINLYYNFINKNNSNIDDVMNHIDYIITLTGEDYLGFGCDFDGIDKSVEGISDVSDLAKIYYKIENKYGQKTADKIMSGNFERVIKEIL